VSFLNREMKEREKKLGIINSRRRRREVKQAKHQQKLG
jgi:hypothetical protein